MMWVLMMISGLCVAQAGAPRAEDQQEQIAALVRQLDDDRWGVRQEAEKALIDMGPEILKLLPDGDARMSPEARERLARVRNQLQVIFANRAVEASRVTLQGTMTVGQALKTIEDATGNQLRGYSDVAERPLTIDLQETPFWEALDRVLDLAGLTVYPYAGDDSALQLMPREEGRADRWGHAYYEGVFRVEPTYVSATYDPRDPSVRRLRVRLALAWEPRTNPIAVSLPLSGITARDDRGETIAVDGASGRLDAAVESDVPIVEMEVPLELPPRAAQTIATLQGSFDVLIPGQTERFAFDRLDAEEQQRQRRAGVTVTLTEIRQNDDVQELSVQIEFDEAANALESHRGWIFKNEAYVLDSEGRRQEHGGRRLIGQDLNSIHVGFMFALDRPLSEYTFVYETPALIIRQPMRFELKHIDLP